MKKKKQRVERLLDKPIDKSLKIAFNCSLCLGDSLIGLVTANNFQKNGYQIDVYGDYAYALRDWFPQMTILPRLSVEQQYTLQTYDVALHMYDTELSNAMVRWHSFTVTLSDSALYLADLTMTDIQVALCKQEFALSEVTRTNDIRPPSHLDHRKYRDRIVIHPTSSLARKNWPAKKYLRLSQNLLAQGYEINFIVSPKERPDWEWLQEHGVALPTFESLSQVASFIYESGYFIGNDSGIGHLASNLDIPTVSIILRKGVAKQWRPTWAPGKVVLSPNWLNPRPIKEKLWKIFTRVKTVEKTFAMLKQECDE